MWRQGIGSFVRNPYASALCPVVICPDLCTSDSEGGHTVVFGRVQVRETAAMAAAEMSTVQYPPSPPALCTPSFEHMTYKLYCKSYTVTTYTTCHIVYDIWHIHHIITCLTKHTRSNIIHVNQHHLLKRMTCKQTLAETSFGELLGLEESDPTADLLVEICLSLASCQGPICCQHHFQHATFVLQVSRQGAALFGSFGIRRGSTNYSAWSFSGDHHGCRSPRQILPQA